MSTPSGPAIRRWQGTKGDPWARPLGRVDRVPDLLPPLPRCRPGPGAALTVRPHWTITLMGGIGADLPLPYRHLMRNCITVRGQWMYPRNAPARLAQLIRAGLLDLDLAA